MFYNRKIKYLDYLENGEKIRNAGFVKIEVSNDKCNIQICVNGLLATDTMQKEVLIRDTLAETELGSIRLECGRGSLCLNNKDANALGEAGLSYERLVAIRIPITKTRELLCKWTDSKENAYNTPKVAYNPMTQTTPVEEYKPAQSLSGQTTAPSGSYENIRSTLPSKQTNPMDSTNLTDSIDQMIPEEPMSMTNSSNPTDPPVYEFESPAPSVAAPKVESLRGGNRDFQWPNNVTMEKKTSIPSTDFKNAKPRVLSAPIQSQKKSSNAVNDCSLHNRLNEDKWKQLSHLYPHIAPFADERDYLSIAPNDFVILRQNHHKLVNNSFLLHGYYNYDHLILGKVSRRGGDQYYLGVPGNFYEKEKQVAVMYGFDRFECKQEPAGEGDFGYYMIPVEI
ncbi:MAG: DUF6128 domain-containing protein [Clostridium sp.]|jgi:hypothetical protein|nr:DUF6128 domain-containing protein [Clostridium sp.]